MKKKNIKRRHIEKKNNTKYMDKREILKKDKHKKKIMQKRDFIGKKLYKEEIYTEKRYFL